MSIYKDLKKAFLSTVDVLADKTSTQAQKSRLVTVIKNEEKIANQAYVALGKYLYTQLRDGMPEDVEQLCAVIDASKQRMSKAQDIYREVIRQEEINTEIGREEVRENFRKVKEPIVATATSKATTASEYVKTTAKDAAVKAETFKAEAAVKAESLKAEAAKKAEDIKTKMREKAAKAEAAEEADDDAEDEMIDTDAETTTRDTEEIENAVSDIDEAAPEEDAECEPDGDAAPMPVEMISEEEFEENEAEVKPLGKNHPITKAKKLKDIMTKKEDE